MSNDHGRFIWYELMTSDVEAAKRFYGEIVGWSTQAMGEYTMFIGSAGPMGGVMQLADEHKAHGVPPNWTAYVYVDDCDAAAEKAKALGGQVLNPPSDIPEVGRFAVIADPHGAVTAIMKPIPPSGSRPEAPRGTLGHGSWHELMAGEVDADFQFYKDLFGWTETGRHEMGPMGVYHLYGNSDGQVGGMMTKPAQLPVACWTYYFESDDVDAAAERVTKAGGAITNGPMDVPDGSRIVQATDPQGVVFALVKTKR